MSDWEIGFAEDLAHVAAMADANTQEALERVARVWQPMWRARLIELLSEVSADLNEVPQLSGRVELRLNGDDIAFALDPAHTPHRDPDAVFASDGEADARISLRVSEALKERVTAAAAADGMSVNTWIARALDRAV